MKEEEIPVDATRAREILGVGSNYMTAVKKAMGIKARYFYLSDVRKFLRDNPDFKIKGDSDSSADTYRGLLAETFACLRNGAIPAGALMKRIEKKLALEC